jgi:VWFA-related protein
MERNMAGFRCIVLASVFVAFPAGATIAQDAGSSGAEVPAATFKLNVRTVLVDVVVTDKSNKAVPGLKKEDFQVFEDGKPQTISFFEPRFASPAGEASATPAPALPPNTFTNVPAVTPNDSVNVLLMDALNTAEGDQSYVHKEMVRYLASIPKGTRIAIFMLGEKLRIIQGFTQDSTVLRASIARLATNPSASALLPTTAGSNASNAAVNMIMEAAVEEGYGGVPDATLESMASALQQFQDQEITFEANQRALLTLEALQQIARYLSGIPGRKNLIWFVGSFPACVPGMTSESELINGGCPYDDQARKTVVALADARVSVYPVDARGLTTQTIYAAENAKSPGVPNSFQTVIAGQTNSLNSDLGAEALNQGNMDLLARDTGGKATYGSNDFMGALAADIENGSRYYTLAYTPTDRKEVGRERKIEIKPASGSYKLSYRRSYYEETPKEARSAEAAPSKDPLRPLMDRGMPNFTELHYRMRVAPAAAQPAADAPRSGDNAKLMAPFTRYTVNFSLATDGLTLVTGPDGIRRETIEVALVAYSQLGKPLNWETRSIGLAIRPEQMQFAQTSGIPFHFDIDAPQGDVYMRAGIYANSSGRAGTLEIPLSSITVASK